MSNNNNTLLLGIAGITGISLLTYYLLHHRKSQIRKVSILDCVGNTPLIYLPRLSAAAGAQIYAKAQFLNPFGSSKDRAVKMIIREAEENGKFKEKKDIIEASSGSTAISMAQMSHILSIKPIVYLPNDLAEQKYNLLQLLGANIIKVPPALIVDPKHFYNLAQTRSTTDNICFSNQFENLSNMHAHYKTTGPEIYKQTDGLLDAFVCSAGTGGTLAGVSIYLKERKPGVKIVLADPQGSGLHNKVKFDLLYTNEEREGYRKKNPFDSITEGIGLNRPTKNFDQAKIDDSYKVTDVEALHLSRYLILNEGLFLGSSSSVNLAAAIKYARQHPNHKIVTILHDSGNRYLSKFYSMKYIQEKDIEFVPKEKYPADDLTFIQ